MAAVTIKEVARKAGVSVATVSRVLNGKGPVRVTTESRIRGIADQLRYVPHGAARSLITRRTNTVGVLLPETCVGGGLRDHRGIGEGSLERVRALLDLS